MNSSEEKTIHILDIFVELLFRWKFILLVTLAAAILAGAIGAVMAVRKNSAEEAAHGVTEEEIVEQRDLTLAELRSAVTEEEAADVERIYAQYSSYIEYRNLLQEEFSSYNKSFDKTGEEMLIQRNSYRLRSVLEGVENQFTTYAMDIEDYKKIREIIPEASSLATAYKYVYFGTISGNTTELTNLGEADAVVPSEYMITVEVVGNNKEMCTEISEIVDAAFQKQLSNVRRVDPDVSLEKVSTNYRGNIYEYYINKKQSTFDNIQKVDSTINSLKTSTIDKLSEDQAAYFSALKDIDRVLIDNGPFDLADLSGEELEMTKASLISHVLIVLGIIVGFFLAVLIVILQYLLNGKIKNGQEMQEYYKVPVLNTFFVKRKKGRGLFPSLIRWILGVDSTEAETKVEMIAADTCGAVEQMGGGSVYFVRTCRDLEDVRVAAMLEKAVSSRQGGCEASSGAPLESVEELHALTRHKNAIILVHSKSTLQADVEKVLDLCRRQSIRVLGTIAITEF